MLIICAIIEKYSIIISIVIKSVYWIIRKELKVEKHDIIDSYSKQEDKLLISKVLDKINLMKKNNKLMNTNFLDVYQIGIIEKLLQKIEFNQFVFTGGFQEAERKMLIVYPQDTEEFIVKKYISKTMQVVKINLPLDLKGQYNHRMYLGGVIKLGIEREKIGDIIVADDGADIIICPEVSQFLLQNLNSLKRFSRAEIVLENINRLRRLNINMQRKQIVVASMRIDNLVSTVAECSRTVAVEMLKKEKVYINYQTEVKPSKIVNEGDLVNIRGKARFIVKDIQYMATKKRK